MQRDTIETLHAGRHGRAMHESVHDDKAARREREAIAFEAAMDAEERLAASLGYGLAAIERAFTPRGLAGDVRDFLHAVDRGDYGDALLVGATPRVESAYVRALRAAVAPEPALGRVA